MTEQTQPTDAEILDAVKHLGAAMLSPVEVARAVLAKWGTPAGAGEVVAWGIFDSQGFYEAASDQESAERFCAHYNKRKGADPLKPYTAKPLTTPQPTQARGGAVPNWQDISTAPKDGTRFVAVGQNYGLYSETQHTCIAQWFRGCWMEASDWNETSELKYLTHWMPLPPLERADRKQGGA